MSQILRILKQLSLQCWTADSYALLLYFISIKIINVQDWRCISLKRCLPDMHKALNLSPNRTVNRCGCVHTQKAEAWKSEVQSHQQLYSCLEFKDGLCYKTLSQKKISKALVKILKRPYPDCPNYLMLCVQDLSKYVLRLWYIHGTVLGGKKSQGLRKFVSELEWLKVKESI